jgi:hypothetical protein
MYREGFRAGNASSGSLVDCVVSATNRDCIFFPVRGAAPATKDGEYGCREWRRGGMEIDLNRAHEPNAAWIARSLLVGLRAHLEQRPACSAYDKEEEKWPTRS